MSPHPGDETRSPRTTEAPHVSAERKWGATRRRSPRGHGRQPVVRGSQPEGAPGLQWQYEPLQNLPADALATNTWLTNRLRDQVYRVVRWWLGRRFHFQVEGAEVFTQLSQFILVANHTSHLDTICLLAALPSHQRNRCYSAAAEDYFYTNAFKAQTARILANTFPFRRREDTQRSLEACTRILERGDSLLFYPEGTRSTTGQLQPFRRGIGMLVQGTPYPVVPVYLNGPYEAMAKGRLVPRPTAIHLRIGAPERFQDMPTGPDAAVVIAKRLEERVRALNRYAEQPRGGVDG